MQNVGWQSDPHIHLYAQISVEQNRSMYNLRDALLVRLKHEGHRVTVIQRQGDALLRFLLQDTRHAVKLADAQSILDAEDLSYSQVLALEQLEVLSPEQQRAISKFYLKDFYCLEELTLEDILADREGRWRGELLNLEAQLNEKVALDRTVKALEKQVSWCQNLCHWDIPGTGLRREIRERLGLTELIRLAANNWEWTRDDLESYADVARGYAPAIKAHLNFTVTDEMSDTQVVHQLFSQLGIKVQFHWSNLHPDHVGEKIRVYSLNRDHWVACVEILARREERRRKLEKEVGGEGGSPLSLQVVNPMGDPGDKTLPGVNFPAVVDGSWGGLRLRSLDRESLDGEEGLNRADNFPDNQALA